MKLYEYVVRRLILMVFVVLGVSILTFYLSRGIPGIDPLAAYITEKTRPEQLARLREYYHLNDPLPIQYIYYLRDLFTGDWGYSKTAGMPVLAALGSKFAATFELSLVAIILSVVIGIPLGIISALKNNRWPDHGSRLLALTGISIPIFWFGLLLQLVFFYYFRIWGLPSLPSAGRVGDDVMLTNPLTQITGLYLVDSLLTFNIPFFLSSIQHLILPSIALCFFNLGLITRIMRSSMLEVLRQDYIVLARSKGLSERVVIYRHALRNALIPTTTVTGLSFGFLLAGAVITETIFSWPGMGRLSVNALTRDDTPTIMGFTLVAAVVIVVVNLIVDVLYAYLDPRIKY